MERRVTVRGESEEFTIMCRPIVKCHECGSRNPPAASRCVTCESAELYEIGDVFEDEIQFVWSEISSYFGGRPKEEEAVEFISDSLVSRASLYETLIDNGWELIELTNDGTIRFEKLE